MQKEDIKNNLSKNSNKTIPEVDKKLIVLQVLPHLDSGGLVSGAIEVSKAIEDCGGKSIVATSGGYRYAELERTGSKIEILPVDSKNIFTIYFNIKRLVKIIKNNNVSIIHARSRAPAWSCLWASRKLNIPLITTYHGTYGDENFIKRKYNKVMVSGFKTIAISDFISGHIRNIYGDMVNIKVIPRGVEINTFSPKAVTAERMINLSKLFKLNDTQSVVLVPGRLTSWKGHKYAIKALSIMKNKNVKMIMVGDLQKRDSYKKQLLKLARSLGVDDRLSIVGHLRDMPAIMMLSDAVISCSEKPEAFGRIILEAQAMGRPVIAFNHGGAIELVKNNENGLLVDKGDVDGLAQCLLEVISMNIKQRKELTIRSIKNVSNLYLTSQMCQKYIELYKEVLNKF